MNNQTQLTLTLVDHDEDEPYLRIRSDLSVDLADAHCADSTDYDGYGDEDQLYWEANYGHIENPLDC